MDTVQLKIFKRLKKLRFYCFHSLFELDSCNMLKMALLYNANPGGGLALYNSAPPKKNEIPKSDNL